MLDASAGPDAPVSASTNTDQPKAGDRSKPADALAKIAEADTDQASAASIQTTAPAPASDPGPAAASTVDFAILAQAVPAGLGATLATASAEKAKDAGVTTTSGPESDQKSDGDDATPAPANGDPNTAISPDASIMAVAAVAAPAATSTAVQSDGVTSDNISAISAQTSTAKMEPLQGSAQAAGAMTNAGGDIAPNKPDLAVQTAVLATDVKAASAQITNTSGEAGGVLDETAGTSGDAPKSLPSVDVAAALSAAGSTSQMPAEPGKADTKAAPEVNAKSLPPAEAQTEGNRPDDRKTGDAKIEPGKVKESPGAVTTPIQAQAASNKAAQGGGTGNDSKMPAAHQSHEQPSEHASAIAQVAVAAAHSDVPAPGAVAQAVTTQLGVTSSAVGLGLATPLASPLQAVWQPAPDRAEGSDKPVPIAGLAVEIVSRAQDGLRRFEIRLDPPELGRIDVRLDVDNGGNVTSRLTVDRPETLDLLRRDAPQLERALQHAGLHTEGGLQFSLRDQNFANRQQQQQLQQLQNTQTFIVPDDEAAAAEAARRGYGRLIGLGSGIDIRV
jgi:chemotaxis protein MotD